MFNHEEIPRHIFPEAAELHSKKNKKCKRTGLWLIVVVAEPDALSHLHALWRAEGLHVLMRLVARAKKHAERLDSTHVPRLQVAEDQNAAVLELIGGHVFDQAGDDRAGLRLSDIDLLDVQRVRVRMALDAEDAADADVHHADKLLALGAQRDRRGRLGSGLGYSV